MYKRLIAAVALAAGGWAAADDEAAVLDDLTRVKEIRTGRVSSAQEDLTRNQDNDPIEAGQTLVLADLTGPGVITHIWCTVASKDPMYSRSLVVRIYWDGADKPSVEAPLGDFFAVGNGASAEVDSAVVNVTADGKSRSCYWRMPFHKSAKITVTCESRQYRADSFYYYVDYEKHASLPADTVYFHARYHQSHPARTGPYVVLDTAEWTPAARGHFVGVVYSALLTDIGWFGEGDDRFYIDREKTPSLSGTGTEDYFNDAWGFREFCRPYFGVPVFDGYLPGDRVTAYRWHLKDPVAFHEALRFEFEHFGSIFNEALEFKGQFFERSDWLSSVAFWYQTPVATFREPIERFEIRTPPYKVLRPSDMRAVAKPEGGLTITPESFAFLPGADPAALEVTFDVAQEGRYQINALLTRSFLGGRYQIVLNGRPVGPVRDFQFNGQEVYWDKLDLHDLGPGSHLLRFESLGPSPHARTIVPPVSGMALAGLALMRLEDIDGYNGVTSRLR